MAIVYSSADAAPIRAPAADAGLAARIEVLDTLEAAEPAWRDLEAQAVVAPFQRFDWVAAWHRHVGARAGIRPLIVVGRDGTGLPQFLLPFAVRSVGFLAVAGVPGGSHAGRNGGLWRRAAAAAATAPRLADLLGRIGASRGVDLFALPRQSPCWRGLDNPLAALPARPTVDDVYGAAFPPGRADDVLKALVTREVRGRLRTKERKLERLAGYRHLRAREPAEVERLVAAFLAQKSAHFAAQGIRDVFAAPGVAAFLREACLAGLDRGAPAIELHGLEGGGEVIAVMGGVADDRHFTCMFNSYTLGENGRFSPGLVLITHVIRDCVERGRAGFDLGPGAAPYKAIFCREPAGLVDVVLPVTWRGRFAVVLVSALKAAKRRAKRHRGVHAAVQWLRRRIAGRIAAAGAAGVDRLSVVLAGLVVIGA